MNWEHNRPDGWEAKPEHPCAGDGCLECRDYSNRETGADAMLEGLKANSPSFEFSEKWEKVSFDIIGKGRAYLVFIPEEQDEKENLV